MDALHQILINFTKQFQPIRKKNYLWWPCLVSDQDKIRTLYKGTSTDALVQKLIHQAKQLQRRRLLNVSTNQKHKSSMATIFCLIQTTWGNFIIKARQYYQIIKILFHLAKQFHSRRFLMPSANQKQESSAAMFVDGSEQN